MASPAKSAHLAAIPVLAILLALASLLIVGRSQNAADQAVVHANEVKASSEGALTLLVDAETGVRGFQATGEASFLEPYDLALAQLPRTLSTLKVLVGDEPDQATRVHQVENLTTSELATLESLRKQEAIGAGRDVRSLGLDTTGRSTMDIIRGKVSAIEATETQVQQARQAQYHDLENLALIIILVGGLGGLGRLVFALVFTTSEEGRRSGSRLTGPLRPCERARRTAATTRYSLRPAPEGIATVAVDGVCTSMNPTGAKILGYQPNEVIGREMHQLVHHHHADGSPYPAASCKIKLASMSAQECRVDGEVFWRKDGTRLPVEYSAAPLLVDGVGRWRGGELCGHHDSGEPSTPMPSVKPPRCERPSAGGELVLHYQPKVELASGAVVGDLKPWSVGSTPAAWCFPMTSSHWPSGQGSSPISPPSSWRRPSPSMPGGSRPGSTCPWP